MMVARASTIRDVPVSEIISAIRDHYEVLAELTPLLNGDLKNAAPDS